MIPDVLQKRSDILAVIRDRVSEINSKYRKGPSLYFYRRTLALRANARTITDFMSQDMNIEILYATLVAWDMNSRGARMKYFDDFKHAILLCEPYLRGFEDRAIISTPFGKIRNALTNLYNTLDLMESGGRLVAISKCLHFMFPQLIMPMDRTNTLNYLYNNTNEIPAKFIEAISFSFDVAEEVESLEIDWRANVDDKWNTGLPKMVDNAIILLRDVSTS